MELKKNCVLVMGMHRSGTSALAKHILDMGFELSSDPLPAHPEDNPRGYWEARDVVMMNHVFMAKMGSSWKDTNPLPKGWLATEAAQNLRISANAYIQEAVSNTNQLLIKDPRICRLLPLWLPLLKRHFDHVAAVFIVRRAEAVYQSLRKRKDSKDISKGAITCRNHALALWTRYNLEAELNSRPLSRLTIGYENWIANPIEETENIVAFLRNSLAAANIQSVSPELVRPRHEDNSDELSASDAQRLVAQIYHELLNRADDGFFHRFKATADVCIPDAHQTEMNQPDQSVIGAAHLKWFSGTTPNSVALLRRYVGKGPKPIVFISDMVLNKCHIYRVKNIVDALNESDIPATWTTSEEIASDLHLLKDVRSIVVHRSRWNRNFEEIFSFCRQHSILVVTDIDDLIFEPQFIDLGYIHFISQLAEDDKLSWKEKIGDFRKTLLGADTSILSTEYITEHLSRHQARSECLPNGYSKENLQLAFHWSSERTVFHNQRRLGYASGSPTHAADFQLIAEPVARFLHQNPEWRLCVVGDLDISNYGNLIDPQQVEKRPLVNHLNLAYELARFHINLIPLERNPFCDAKSPLKWYEAALCGVPSIATGNSMYEQLFHTNNSGLLARDQYDWLKHMTRLASDPGLCLKIATNAKNQCLEMLQPRRLAEQLDRFLSASSIFSDR